MTSWVLGLNGRPVAYHDAAACLVGGDGRVAAFAEEERFTRSRHGIQAPPRHAARFCLESAGVRPEDVDVVAVGWNVPFLRRRFGRTWDSSSGKDLLRELLGPGLADRMRARLEFVPHHLAHALLALGASGLPEAAVLVVDGQGEDASISVYRGEAGRGAVPIRSWSPRHSLGFLYEAASEWLGFGFLQAGKTMGLAAYGRADGDRTPILLSPAGDDAVFPGGPAVEEDVVDFWKGVFSELAGRPGPSAPADRLDEDSAAVRVAWTAQRTVEHAMAELAAFARTATGLAPLCVAGGVALNCAANGLIPEPVYVPPVPHDAGVALGAAWAICPPPPGEPLRPDLGSPIGPIPGDTSARAPIRIADLDPAAVADRLAAGQVGAVAEGRAEIGPRALGRRSIIAVPRPASVADRLNRIKGREPWRPFGPVAPASRSAAWWESRAHLDRYMVGAVPTTGEGALVAPAVRHVDGTTRPQAIRGGESSPLVSILAAMERAGLPPVLVNTSFNRRGEPIVDGVRDALDAFLAMDLDFLLLGGLLVTKTPAGVTDDTPPTHPIVTV
ncbi:carbamoyltransferase C-terminal domain-containing protein [Rhizohabitans arisaemae]|uniref:carbamoyltransferase C-terminal domain-containing protein n=1 Tax=Rhizohabitans arisaemae TaxID=2720610 RepID=UPI0024B262CD|nr:carbamoyltransferase C-terminal domain-containing protein [Rhizohabitans arisaemae]